MRACVGGCDVDGKVYPIDDCEVCPRPSMQQPINGKVTKEPRKISIGECPKHKGSMPILFTRGSDVVVGPYCGTCLDEALSTVVPKLPITER